MATTLYGRVRFLNSPRIVPEFNFRVICSVGTTRKKFQTALASRFHGLAPTCSVRLCALNFRHSQGWNDWHTFAVVKKIPLATDKALRCYDRRTRSCTKLKLRNETTEAISVKSSNVVPCRPRPFSRMNTYRWARNSTSLPGSPLMTSQEQDRSCRFPTSHAR